VLDNAEGGDGKEFYTITTANKNVFYLIIGRQRTNDNVYFLNPVTEQDLMSLADVSKDTEAPQASVTPAAITVIPTITPGTPEVTLTAAPEPVTAEGGGVNLPMVIVIFAVGAGFVCVYYYLVIRPKRQNKGSYKEDDDTDENDSDTDDDMDNGFEIGFMLY